MEWAKIILLATKNFNWGYFRVLFFHSQGVGGVMALPGRDAFIAIVGGKAMSELDHSHLGLPEYCRRWNRRAKLSFLRNQVALVPRITHTP